MCLSTYDQNSAAGRLRRKGAAVAASSASLGAVPALSFTHGHPILGAICIATQVCLITVACGLLAKAKRLPSS